MKCPNCGKENPENAKYCFNCGIVIKKGPFHEFFKSKIGKIIILVLIISIICGGLITYSMINEINNNMQIINNNDTKILNNTNHTNTILEESNTTNENYFNENYSTCYPKNGTYKESNDNRVYYYDNNGYLLGYTQSIEGIDSSVEDYKSTLESDGVEVFSSQEVQINNISYSKLTCYQDGDFFTYYGFNSNGLEYIIVTEDNMTNSEILINNFEPNQY